MEKIHTFYFFFEGFPNGQLVMAIGKTGVSWYKGVSGNTQTKRFFCIFRPKITCFYIHGGEYVHFTPKKCFLEAYSTKCP